MDVRLHPGRASLRTKMVASMVSLVLLLGLAGMLHARYTLAAFSNEDLDRHGVAIARDLESHAGDKLLTNDLYGLYERISALMAANDDVRYIVVLDRDGGVRASTFKGGLPDGLRQANFVRPGDPYTLVSLNSNEEEVRDVAFPVQRGALGTVRVGLPTGRVHSRVQALTTNLLGLTALGFSSALAVSFVLATMLTRPLARLSEAARAFSRGEQPAHMQLADHPDVGHVAIAFDAMTTRLREKEEERTRLLGRMIAAQEDERRRISRELHDEAGQSLASISLGLSHLEGGLEDEELRARAQDLRAMTASALERMRRLARDLRPSTLDDLGLVAALARYVAEFGTTHGVETDFHADDLAGAGLSAAAETALYRIAQEALTNVSRHARATSVNVLLERREQAVVLVIEDDGVGFDVASVRRHGSIEEKLGLLGMEERAMLAGGRLLIESRPGGGAAIFAEVQCGGQA